MPRGNGGAIAGWLGGAIIIAGGTTWQDGVKLFPAEVLSFEPSAQRWDSVGQLSQPVAYAATGVVDNELWAVGGASESGPVRAITVLSDKGRVARTLNLDLPVVYAAGAASAKGEGLFVVGGTRNDRDLTTAVAELRFISDGGRADEQLPSLPDGPRLLAAAVAVGDELFVFGGATPKTDGPGVRNLSTCWAYSTQTRAWRRLAELPTPRRGPVAVRLHGRYIVVAAGFGQSSGGSENSEDTFLNDLLVYDTVTNQFRTGQRTPYPALLPMVMASGNRLYFLGGEDQPKARSARAYECQIRSVKR